MFAFTVPSYIPPLYSVLKWTLAIIPKLEQMNPVASLSLLLFALLTPLIRCHAEYTKNVIKLSGATFNEQVLKNEVSGLRATVIQYIYNTSLFAVETGIGQILCSLLWSLP